MKSPRLFLLACILCLPSVGQQPKPTGTAVPRLVRFGVVEAHACAMLIYGGKAA